MNLDKILPSQFNLTISEPYEYRGVMYVNYDFTFMGGIRYAYFSVCIDKKNLEYFNIPEAYDYSDWKIKEHIEGYFKRFSNRKIINLFTNHNIDEKFVSIIEKGNK